MKASIALCTRNGAEYLYEQLDSLAAQSRQPHELIVFDDASDDSTVPILDDFVAKAPFRVRIHRNSERVGTIRNFENAIRACSGDVIFLCDQDDVWMPHKIAVVAAALERDRSLACIFTDATRITDSGSPLGSLWQHIAFDGDVRELLDRNVATGATIAFRSSYRDLILPIPHDKPMLHDEWIALLLFAAARVGTIAEPLIMYREHSGQQVGAGKPAGGMRRWIESARETGAADYKWKAERLRLVAERVPHRAKELTDRAAHFEARASLPVDRTRRVGSVIREMPRYFRYSNHVWSIGRDLLWK